VGERACERLILQQLQRLLRKTHRDLPELSSGVALKTFVEHFISVTDPVILRERF